MVIRGSLGADCDHIVAHERARLEDMLGTRVSAMAAVRALIIRAYSSSLRETGDHARPSRGSERPSSGSASPSTYLCAEGSCQRRVSEEGEVCHACLYGVG